METMITTDLTTKTLDKVKYSFSNWVSEFRNTGVSDYEFDEINLRIFVDFETLSLRRVKIKAIEILDAEYEEIDSENALILRQYIKQTIKEYNNEIESKCSDGWNYREELARERYYNQKYGV